MLAEYGPPKTLYNRLKRWSDMGVFASILMGLAEQASNNETIFIDSTYLKAHRTSSSLRLKRGARTSDRAHERRTELEIARPRGREGPPYSDVPVGRPNLGLHRRAGSTVLDPACRRPARRSWL